jgi:hypothetical protein
MKLLCRAVLLFLVGLLGAKEPEVVYLTWVGDPTSAMTILWHTSKNGSPAGLTYHIKGETQSLVAEARAWRVDGTETYVHRVDLEGLKEDSDYLFKIEGDRREYRFKTMPRQLVREVRFAVGGDAYYYWGTEVFKRMNLMIKAHDPDFYVIGGDLAYTIGKKRLLRGRGWELHRWQMFLRTLQRTIRGPEGRLIPFLPVVGNHDVKSNSSKPQMFYELFAFPEGGKAYRSLDFGKYLRLVLLDTGHTTPIVGGQTEWLSQTLQTSEAAYTFPIYHVSAYPSYYPFLNKTSDLLRGHWVPLFEKYQLSVAFEHHNHCYKKTHPIKAGKIDPTGVVYLGDGSWGVAPRQPNSNLWYMEKVSSINSVYIVSLSEKGCTIEAKTSKGETLDQMVVRPAGTTMSLQEQ